MRFSKFLVGSAVGSIAAFVGGAIILTFTITIDLEKIGGVDLGGFDVGAAEIAAYSGETQFLYVINGEAETLDLVDIQDPTDPQVLTQVDLSDLGSPTHVAVSGGTVAVALANADVQANGFVALLDLNGDRVNSLTVGALPDMLTFTPNGRYLLVANEGEPKDYCEAGLENDPEGSVSVIDMLAGAANLTQGDVRTADFRAFNDVELPEGIRIFGPNATVAQDLEPEYIAVSSYPNIAYVSLQENNALAVVDIPSATVLGLIPLGTKDHSLPNNGLDASNQDDGINIQTYPVRGMYQPDGIAAFDTGQAGLSLIFGDRYLISANEGDARDYECYSEEERVGDLELDPDAYPDAATLQENAVLGRLNTTTATGDTDGDGDVDQIYSYGARSFSIWKQNGELVYDSGDQFEQILAAELPDDFNSNNDENGSFDSRSDDKGPEPEGVAVAQILSRTFAFIGLERVGGVMVYDITNPRNPTFVQYINSRDFSVEDATTPEAGDLGPEGILFIPEGKSPNGKALLVTANEISGTVAIYQITPRRIPAIIRTMPRSLSE